MDTTTEDENLHFEQIKLPFVFEKTSLSFEVRPYIESDFEQCRQLFVNNENLMDRHDFPNFQAIGQAYARFVSTHASSDMFTKDSLRDTYLSQSQSPRGNFWVCVHQPSGLLVGQVALQYKEGRVGELRRMAALRAFRGNGIARMLVSALVKFASDEGFQSIFLTTPEINLPAIRLYEQYDFKLNKKMLLQIQDKEGQPMLDMCDLPIVKLVAIIISSSSIEQQEEERT